MKALLLDIEGTTTPISFVYEVLFPFAREHMLEYLKAHWLEEDVSGDVAGLSDEILKTPEEATARAHQLMGEDKKLGPLKSLQGRIWEHGYKSGKLQGQLFPEVADRLKAYKEANIPVAIYSSGSVLAQKLLFGYSQAGDLTPFLTDYFDTAVGAKTEAESYRLIAQRLKIDPKDGLFLTDVVAEAQAAHQAGWQTAILVRPGNHPQPPHNFSECTELPAEV